MFRIITFRIILLFIFSPAIFGISGLATGQTISSEGKKYAVTFGESYPNYLPGSSIRMSVTFKNNTPDYQTVNQELIVVDSAGLKVWKTVINLDLSSNQTMTLPLMIPVPKTSGSFTLKPGDVAIGNGEANPSFDFKVIQPKKSSRLSKILVHTPDSEVVLNAFLKSWDIKAPTISWGQVLLLGKKSWTLFAAGDKEISQLIDRALKREMSVIFLDFGPTDDEKMGNLPKIDLPFNVSVSFVKAVAPEQNFDLKAENKELTFDFSSNQVKMWNGYYGITVPAVDMRFDGKGVKINGFVTTGHHPFRYPVVEMVPLNGKGKLYICQLLTDGRLDPAVKTTRNHPELPAYDPVAVQFLLNLISATVGDNLLK